MCFHTPLFFCFWFCFVFFLLHLLFILFFLFQRVSFALSLSLWVCVSMIFCFLFTSKIKLTEKKQSTGIGKKKRKITIIWTKTWNPCLDTAMRATYTHSHEMYPKWKTKRIESLELKLARSILNERMLYIYIYTYSRYLLFFHSAFDAMANIIDVYILTEWVYNQETKWPLVRFSVCVFCVFN